RRLGGHWTADDHRCAELRRARGDDATRWRSVRIFARSLQSALGISLWLDTVPRDPDRNNRRSCGRVCSFSRCVYGCYLADTLDSSANRALGTLRRQPLDTTGSRDRTHRILNDRKYARPAAWETYPECFHFCEDAGALRISGTWHFYWPQRGRAPRQLREFLDADSCFSDHIGFAVRRGRLRGCHCARNGDRDLRCASRFPVFGGRLEQHYLYGGGGARTAAKYPALTFVRHGSGNQLVPAGKCSLPLRVAVG